MTAALHLRVPTYASSRAERLSYLRHSSGARKAPDTTVQTLPPQRRVVHCLLSHGMLTGLQDEQTGEPPFSVLATRWVGLTALLGAGFCALAYLAGEAGSLRGVAEEVGSFLRIHYGTQGQHSRIEAALLRLFRLGALSGVGLVLVSWLVGRALRCWRPSPARPPWKAHPLTLLDVPVLVGLAAVAAILRLSGLGQSLWLDELGQYYVFVEPGLPANLLPRVALGPQPYFNCPLFCRLTCLVRVRWHCDFLYSSRQLPPFPCSMRSWSGRANLEPPRSWQRDFFSSTPTTCITPGKCAPTASWVSWPSCLRISGCAGSTGPPR